MRQLRHDPAQALYRYECRLEREQHEQGPHTAHAGARRACLRLSSRERRYVKSQPEPVLASQLSVF